MTEWQQHMARLLADKGDAWFRHEPDRINEVYLLSAMTHFLRDMADGKSAPRVFYRVNGDDPTTLQALMAQHYPIEPRVPADPEGTR